MKNSQDQKSQIITLLRHLKNKGLTQNAIRKLTGIPERTQRRYLNQPFEVKKPSKKLIEKAGAESKRISKDGLRYYETKTFKDMNIKGMNAFIKESKLRFVWFKIGIEFTVVIDKNEVVKLIQFNSATDQKENFEALLTDEFERLEEMLHNKYTIIAFRLLYVKVVLTDFTE